MSHSRSDALPLQIRLNGEARQVESGTTYAELVDAILEKPVPVAVERNGEILTRSRWSTTPLAEGDEVEIVRFVQGG